MGWFWSLPKVLNKESEMHMPDISTDAGSSVSIKNSGGSNNIRSIKAVNGVVTITYNDGRVETKHGRTVTAINGIVEVK